MSTELAVEYPLEKLKRAGDNMKPCFTPEWQVKNWVNLLSILTADLSFAYTEINTSKKRP